jgi:hypothetical protein
MTCELRRAIETKTGINVTHNIKLIFTQAQLCCGLGSSVGIATG